MDLNYITQRQAFTVEFTISMILLFLATGVGLDPRQKAVFGSALAPIFVGLSLGLCSFSTGFVARGYTGACKSYTSISPHSFDAWSRSD